MKSKMSAQGWYLINFAEIRFQNFVFGVQLYVKDDMYYRHYKFKLTLGLAQRSSELISSIVKKLKMA